MREMLGVGKFWAATVADRVAMYFRSLKVSDRGEGGSVGDLHPPQWERLAMYARHIRDGHDRYPDCGLLHHCPPPRHIFLSPHLDDAVLSCGGQIAGLTRRHEGVLIVTFFTESPPTADLSEFARTHHRIWGNSTSPFVRRRQEDRAAAWVLGACWRHGGFVDAIYRADTTPAGKHWLYDSPEKLFGPLDPLDLRLVEGLEVWVRGHLPARDDCMVYAPLGVGNHVDHQLVHRMSRLLVAQGYQVLYYEEFPYVQNEAAQQRALAQLVTIAMQAPVRRLSHQDLQRKLAAIQCYRSQIPMLFGSTPAMIENVKAYAAQVGGERLWYMK